MNGQACVLASSILDRVAGLGSDKWRVHIRARQMMARASR
jgi:hypothetical protein